MPTPASITAIKAATAKMIDCSLRCFGSPRFRVALLGTRNLFFLKKYHKNFRLPPVRQRRRGTRRGAFQLLRISGNVSTI
jgi:hypothetical protein